MANLGYVFYNKPKSVIEATKDLSSYKQKKDEFSGTDGYRFFDALVTYPGLLVGIGYPGNGKDTDSIKNGFSFDYCTGLPYVPGSSIKGIIKKRIRDYSPAVIIWLENKNSEYLKDISPSNEKKKFNDLSESEQKEYKGKFTKKILNDLFEEKDSSGSRDVFLGAYISKDYEGKEILKPESITPHGNIFEQPNPLKHLRIAPDVMLRIGFIMKEEEIKGLSKDIREELYKTIILDLGIGAKTNHGYGHLIEVKKK